MKKNGEINEIMKKLMKIMKKLMKIMKKLMNLSINYQ